MLLHDSKSTSILAYPAIASAAVLLFLLRNRQITEGNSPGSGVSIAGAEILSRLSVLVHSVFLAAEQASSLLLHVSFAPTHVALNTLQSEFVLAATAMERLTMILQHAVLLVQHAL